MADKIIVCIVCLLCMIKGAYSKSLVNFGQSLEGENYAWLDDPEYPKSDRETFGKGSFTLGVPTDHSCLEKSFMVHEGRLICTKTKKDAIMCIPSCKEGLHLRTGYSDKSSVVSKFPIYICHAGTLFWTDVESNKLALPNPRCLPKEDFLMEMLDDANKSN